MAISYVGSDSAVGTNVAFALTFGPTLLQGDIVVLVGGSSFTTTVGTTTTGYADAVPAFLVSGNSRQLWVGYKIMGASPDTSVSCNGSGNTLFGTAYTAFYFRGVDGATPLDATATTASALSGAPDAPSITTVTDNAIVLACGAGISDASITVPTGYSNQTQGNSGGVGGTATAAAAWKAIASHGAEDPAAWGGWSSSWCAASVALRQAATNVSITPSVGTFAFTGQAPAASIGQTVAPSAGALAFVGQQPGVSTGRTISPSVGALALTGQAPLVTATDNRNATLSVGALAFVGQQPVVTVTAFVVVQPSPGSFAFVGVQPVVTQAANFFVAPGSGALSFVPAAPVITVVAPIGVSVSENIRVPAQIIRITAPRSVTALLASPAVDIETLLAAAQVTGIRIPAVLTSIEPAPTLTALLAPRVVASITVPR